MLVRCSDGCSPCSRPHPRWSVPTRSPGREAEMSIDQPALTAAISTLRAEHLQRDELDGSLRRVVEATCSLFAVAGAGLMLVDDGSRLRYVAATDGRSAALEAAQSETGEGPCVDSLLQGRVVTTEDLGTDARWPRLSTIVRG